MLKTKLFDFANHTFITIFSILCTLPLILVFMVSITDERAIQLNGYSFFPEQFSTAAYRILFLGDSPLMQSYIVSSTVTLTGTFIAVLITAMAGYTLAAKHVKYRNTLAMYFFITTVFSTGLVPWYMVNTALGLKNTILALIIPSLLFNPFNLFLVRNYMRQIDAEGDVDIPRAVDFSGFN